MCISSNMEYSFLWKPGNFNGWFHLRQREVWGPAKLHSCLTEIAEMFKAHISTQRKGKQKNKRKEECLMVAYSIWGYGRHPMGMHIGGILH